MTLIIVISVLLIAWSRQSTGAAALPDERPKRSHFQTSRPSIPPCKIRFVPRAVRANEANLAPLHR
jgi:hypothetical protein